jgi:hypothetical protein
MKLKHIALAALVAASGFANAAVIDNGQSGNGGLFFSVYDGANSYTRNLSYTIDSFEAAVAATGSFAQVWAADATFLSYMSTANLASLKFNVGGVDVVGARRLLETFSTLPTTANKANDVMRVSAGATASFLTAVNVSLATADSAVFAQGTAGYAGNIGNTLSTTLNFSNAGTLVNDASNPLSLMRIDALAGGIAKSIYTQYADPTAINVYMDSANSLHISAITAAVPEPETYAMLLAGLGLMGAVARRRNKKSA